MRVVLVVLLLAPILSGCVGRDTTMRDPPAQKPTAQYSSVVGLVDEGINVYHEVFQDPSAILPTTFLDAVTGAKPIPVHLSHTGNATQSFEMDKPIWENLEPNRLYWFVGTRILAMSPARPVSGPIIYVDGGHGTGVASVLRNVSHDTWIVMVPDLLDIEHKPENVAALGAPSAIAIRWLARQPWLDVISLSLGYPGNPPVAWNEVAQATFQASIEGKLIVSGAGDSPQPNIQTGTSGPPWVISVGGAEPSTHGIASGSSTSVDVMSDFTRRIATSGTDNYLVFSGTSFSAPLVAGVLGEALIHVREQARDASRGPGVLCTCDGRMVTLASLRAALNLSGVYWSANEWEPLNYSRNPVEAAAFFTLPVTPAPWVQMGWGYIGDDSWRGVVATLQGNGPPPKPEGAIQYMGQQQALRETYWSTVPYESP